MVELLTADKKPYPRSPQQPKLNIMMILLIKTNLSKCDRGGEPMMMVGEGNPETFALKSISIMIFGENRVTHAKFAMIGNVEELYLVPAAVSKTSSLQFPCSQVWIRGIKHCKCKC